MSSPQQPLYIQTRTTTKTSSGGKAGPGTKRGASPSSPSPPSRTTGNIRIFALPANVSAPNGYTEFTPAGWEIEMIPDPDPRWDVYDAIRDATGAVFVRTPSGMWQNALGLDDDPVRPFTKLVPAP